MYSCATQFHTNYYLLNCEERGKTRRSTIITTVVHYSTTTRTTRTARTARTATTTSITQIEFLLTMVFSRRSTLHLLLATTATVTAFVSKSPRSVIEGISSSPRSTIISLAEKSYLDDVAQTTWNNDDRTSEEESNNDDSHTLLALLRIAASTGRGEYASPDQKNQASELIVALEKTNPTPQPAKDPKIYGRWELVYSSTELFRSSPFFMAGRAVCSTTDQLSSMIGSVTCIERYWQSAISDRYDKLFLRHSWSLSLR